MISLRYFKIGLVFLKNIPFSLSDGLLYNGFIQGDVLLLISSEMIDLAKYMAFRTFIKRV